MITLANVKSEHGHISVMRSRQTGAVVYLQGCCHQSEADSRGVSLAAYVHALHDLLRQSKSKDVLLIGCGGGTLATMLAATNARIAMIDINSWSFKLAREYFSLPANVECHVVDGRQFLASTSRTFDAIVLDAYDGSEIPGQFCDEAFGDIVRTHLNPDGVFLVNAFVHHDFDLVADKLATVLRRSWTHIRILDQLNSSSRNAIVMAGDVDKLQRPALVSSPQYGGEQIADTLQQMQFRPWRHSR